MATLEDRAAAMEQAKSLLTYLDHDTEDLIIVADWLVTGSADTALAFSRQRTENYHQSRLGELGPDAATWTSPKDPSSQRRLTRNIPGIFRGMFSTWRSAP